MKLITLTCIILIIFFILKNSKQTVYRYLHSFPDGTVRTYYFPMYKAKSYSSSGHKVSNYDLPYDPLKKGSQTLSYYFNIDHLIYAYSSKYSDKPYGVAYTKDSYNLKNLIGATFNYATMRKFNFGKSIEDFEFTSYKISPIFNKKKSNLKRTNQIDIGLIGFKVQSQKQDYDEVDPSHYSSSTKYRKTATISVYCDPKKDYSHSPKLTGIKKTYETSSGGGSKYRLDYEFSLYSGGGCWTTETESKGWMVGFIIAASFNIGLAVLLLMALLIIILCCIRKRRRMKTKTKNGRTKLEEDNLRLDELQLDNSDNNQNQNNIETNLDQSIHRLENVNINTTEPPNIQYPIQYPVQYPMNNYIPNEQQHEIPRYFVQQIPQNDIGVVNYPPQQPYSPNNEQFFNKQPQNTQQQNENKKIEENNNNNNSKTKEQTKPQ